MIPAVATLPSLLRQFLTDASDGPSRDLAAAIRERVREAPLDEIEAGFHELWLVARHWTREAWWWRIADQGNAAKSRDEVQRFIDTENEKLPPSGWVVAQLPAFAKFTIAIDRARDDARAAIQEAAAMIFPKGDPLERWLPPLDEYAEEFHFREDKALDLAESTVDVLKDLASVVHHRFQDHWLFWAVVGPLWDAMNVLEPQGFALQIEEARGRLAAERLLGGRADLWDWWVAIQDQCADVKAFDGFIKYLRTATAAECEALFADPVVTMVGPKPAEIAIGRADELWSVILQKPQISALLLARAGCYYWHSSPRREGPGRALAAFGVRCEGEKLYHLYQAPPYLVFWSAARTAAAEQQWELAADCLDRALLDIWKLLPKEKAQVEGQSQEDESHGVSLNTKFVADLGQRSRDPERQRRTRRCAYYALSTLKNTEWTDGTELARTFADVGRRVGATEFKADLRLGDSLGDVRSMLADGTWRLLLAAESFWEMLDAEAREDYGPVGNQYRRALEHEWRCRLPRELSGKYLAEMLDKMTSPMGRSMLSKFKIDATLLSNSFVTSAGQVFELLNKASHAPGLNRQECLRLRQILLRQGLLKDLLRLVQRSGPSR